jgi:DNA polymerase-3 subunit epsilon
MNAVEVADRLRAFIALLGQPLACLDIETTGSHTERDRITEIGIVTLHPDGSQSNWSCLIHPGCAIPARITTLTGITNEMVADQLVFAHRAQALLERLENHIVIAHNARFDLGFLKQAFRREGIRFNPPVLCSVKLSRQMFPTERRHNLDSVMQRMGLSCAARHRALGDAAVVADFITTLACTRAEELLAACRAQRQRPSLPPHLAPERIDEIPDTPGVYLMYGDGALPLYIGKSIHLRRRVLDHFRNDHREQKEMRLAQAVQHIDWIETPGELSALLLESRLIKTLSPLFNRKLRRTRDLCTWHWVFGSDQPPRLLRGDDVIPGSCYGPFRHATQAKQVLRELAAKHGLCDIRLGLQSGSGPCFAHQIKRCRGVCVGQESSMQHDLRLATALEELRIKQWPYDGPVVLHESDDHTGASWHVIDQWVHWGTAHNEAELDAVLEHPRPNFDRDTYLILLRHLDPARVTPLSSRSDRPIRLIEA